MIFPTQNRLLHPLDLSHFQRRRKCNFGSRNKPSWRNALLYRALNQVLAFKTTYRIARLIWYSWNPMWLSMRWLICFEIRSNVSVYVKMNLRISLFFHYVPTFSSLFFYSSRFAKILDLSGHYNASNYCFTKFLSRK